MRRAIPRLAVALTCCIFLTACLVSRGPLIPFGQAEFPLPANATLIQVASAEPNARELGRATLVREADGYRLHALSGADFAEQNNSLFQLKRITVTADTALYALQSKDAGSANWLYASVLYWPRNGIAYFRMFDGVGNCAELRDHGLLRGGMTDSANGCTIPNFATLAEILRQDMLDRTVNTTARIYRVK